MRRSARRKLVLSLLVFLCANVCLAQTFSAGPLPGGNFLYSYDGNVYLAGSRTNFFVGETWDNDIYYVGCVWSYVPDDLATYSPWWEVTSGSFPFGNTGNGVTWQAPDDEISAINIMFYVEDLPFFADDIVSTPTRTATIRTLVPYVDYVSFLDCNAINPNEHDIYQVDDPVWDYEGKNEPASYTKRTFERVRGEFGHWDVVAEEQWADVALAGETAYYVSPAVLIGPGGYGTYGLSGHTSVMRLPEDVNVYTRTLYWWYRVPNGSNNWMLMQDNPTGPHTLYTVFGPPKCGYANYTKSNLMEAVGKAIGGTTEPNIASKANDHVGEEVFLAPGIDNCICESGFQINFDAAMDRYPPVPPKGMCCCRAEGLNCVLQVLGIGPYTHDYVNELAEPNPDKALPDGQICPVCRKACLRLYWDGFWNQWEGVVKARPEIAATCYAPAQGKIPIDEGTYTAIRNAIATDPNLGFKWAWGNGEFDFCTHMAPP